MQADYFVKILPGDSTRFPVIKLAKLKMQLPYWNGYKRLETVKLNALIYCHFNLKRKGKKVSYYWIDNKNN